MSRYVDPRRSLPIVLIFVVLATLCAVAGEAQQNQEPEGPVRTCWQSVSWDEEYEYRGEKRTAKAGMQVPVDCDDPEPVIDLVRRSVSRFRPGRRSSVRLELRLGEESVPEARSRWAPADATSGTSDEAPKEEVAPPRVRSKLPPEGR